MLITWISNLAFAESQAMRTAGLFYQELPLATTNLSGGRDHSENTPFDNITGYSQWCSSSVFSCLFTAVRLFLRFRQNCRKLLRSADIHIQNRMGNAIQEHLFHNGRMK